MLEPAKYHKAIDSEFPSIVNLEVFRGECPCSCVHCPVGIVEPRHRKKHFASGAMQLELFDRIAQEIAANPHSVLRIHSTGEPLLWKDLPKALDIIKNTGVNSWLFTSGITSDRVLLRKICRSIEVVEISINNINKEEYRITKGTEAFELVAGNIKYMRNCSGNRNHPRLIVSRVQSKNRKADSEFIEYWKNSGLVDDAFVRSYHTYNSLLQGFGKHQSDMDSVESSGHAPCLVHWARFNISRTGKAVVCFNELFKPNIHPDLIYGDVNQSDIATLWKCAKIEAIRTAELSSNYNDPLIPLNFPCKQCEFCQPLFGRENVETSEHQIEMYRRMLESKARKKGLC